MHVHLKFQQMEQISLGLNYTNLQLVRVCDLSHTQMTATTQHILIAPAVRRVQKHESHEYSDL